MALGTQDVFAVAAFVLLVAGVVATLVGRDQIGIWAIAVGFASASAWSILGYYWSQENPTWVPTDQYIALASMAVVATIYYGFKAMNATGLEESM